MGPYRTIPECPTPFLLSLELDDFPLFQHVKQGKGLLCYDTQERAPFFSLPLVGEKVERADDLTLGDRLSFPSFLDDKKSAS